MNLLKAISIRSIFYFQPRLLQEVIKNKTITIMRIKYPFHGDTQTSHIKSNHLSNTQLTIIFPRVKLNRTPITHSGIHHLYHLGTNRSFHPHKIILMLSHHTQKKFMLDLGVCLPSNHHKKRQLTRKF